MASICYWLGRFSLPLYLNHYYIRCIFKYIKPSCHYLILIIFYLLCSIISAAIAMYSVKGISSLLLTFKSHKPKTKETVFTNPTANKRNGIIDLLRFLFAIAIVLYHGRNIGGGTSHPLFTPYGYIGVEFFFFVSGFLLAKSAAHMTPVNTSNLGMETLQFLWHKIKKILPYYLFAAIASFPFLFIGKNLKNAEIIKRTLMSAYDLCFLGASGVKTYTIVRGSWYLSAMFISTLVIYPLLRRFKDIFTCIIAPLSAIILLGYISQTYGNLNQYIAEYTIVYSGLLRAFAEMCIGCFGYEVCERIRLKSLTFKGQIFVSVFCLIGFTGVFISMNYVSEPYFDFALLFIISVCTTLVFSGLGVINKAKIFEYPLFSYLGKLSMVLYLNQFWIKSIITAIFPKSLGYSYLLFIYAVTDIIVSVFIIDIIRFFNKFKKRNLLMIRGLFIISTQEDKAHAGDYYTNKLE